MLPYMAYIRILWAWASPTISSFAMSLRAQAEGHRGWALWRDSAGSQRGGSSCGSHGPRWLPSAAGLPSVVAGISIWRSQGVNHHHWLVSGPSGVSSPTHKKSEHGEDQPSRLETTTKDPGLLSGMILQVGGFHGGSPCKWMVLIVADPRVGED